MQRIALSSWSLNTFFRDGLLDWRGYFATVRGLGLDAVEMNNHFFTRLDDAYIAQIDEARQAYGIDVVNLAVDEHTKFPYVDETDRARFADTPIGGGLASDDEAQRRYLIDMTKRWIDIAKRLGGDTVRNNTGGPVDHVDEAAVARCAASFRELCDYAGERGMRLCIENHGGISSNIDALDLLFQQVDHPNLIQALDFGNWPAERRYESVERSTHRAGIIHPKTHDFDEHGEQPEWDTYRMAREVMSSGFEGPWVIEFEGKTGDRFEGIRLSIAMIERCWQVLERETVGA